MTPLDREAVLARGDHMWDELRAALDAHLDEPIAPATDWTGHDVYAHFARWQQLSVTAARKLLAGRRPADPEADDDTLNDRWRAEDSARPTAEVRDLCLHSRRDLRQILTTITDDEWAAWGHLVAADIDGSHYEHHLAVAGGSS